MDDEDDPVEAEINIHLSKELSKNLYVLQYPVRPKYMTYDGVDLLGGKVKPNQKKLELEVGLNTRSKHYASSKGEQFALNVDGREPDATSFYNSNLMDKQVLTSSPGAINIGRYVVGFMKQGELYLSPVQAQVQMKPSFDYLDKVDVRVESKQAAQDAAGESSQDEGEEEAKAVTVKFARPESDVAKARRLASFNHLKKKQEEEAWVSLRYHNIQSDISERERRRLGSDKKEPSNEFHVEPSDYLNMLMAHADEVDLEKPAMPSNVLSLTQLKSMPLNDQVKALLTNAKVIRFNQLLHLLPKNTDPQATLRALQIVAVLVQGCWVVKSEVLYPKDGCSPNSGISSELLCRGRDFLMWRFTQSRCVTRKEIASVIKLPSEDVKDILEQMSRIKFSQGWEFVFPHDYEFTDRFPDICERQRMLWEAKYSTLSKQLGITEAQEKKIREVAAAEASAEKPRRRRTSSRSRKRTLSGRSVSDQSDMELETDIDVALRETNSNQKNGLSVFSDNLVIELADGYDGPENELNKELRAFIKDKLYIRYILSISELRRLLNIKLAESPPGHVLSRGISDELIEQTVIHVGGIALNSKWQEEKVFMYIKTQDDTEQLRKVIADVAVTSYKITKKAVLKRLEAQSGQAYSDAEIKSVMKDYCVNRQCNYMLKCCSDWS